MVMSIFSSLEISHVTLARQTARQVASPVSPWIEVSLQWRDVNE